MSENQVQKMREELIALGMSEDKVAAIMAEVQRQLVGMAESVVIA